MKASSTWTMFSWAWLWSLAPSSPVSLLSCSVDSWFAPGRSPPANHKPGTLGANPFASRGTDMTSPPPKTSDQNPTMLSKVPEITLYFWVIKVLCTTVGETAADLLDSDLGLGLNGTSLVMGVLL